MSPVLFVNGLFLLCWIINYSEAIKPEIHAFHFGRMLKSGQRVSVMCAVTVGQPPFTFTWFKDGTVVSESETVTIRNIDEFNSNLAIIKLGPEHNGNYTCRVTNNGGSSEQSDVLSMMVVFPDPTWR
ncbi:ig-like domain-containing protein [Nephila pilipes]|uniref:Ig-like domain-containing protein n=1 Tax=Nephila pilipes TaxID=299642 RepID=A0A8X6QSX8_NEPPI|nr:ig-like domain-containing protein [Nephila pilipes]